MSEWRFAAMDPEERLGLAAVKFTGVGNLASVTMGLILFPSRSNAAARMTVQPFFPASISPSGTLELLVGSEQSVVYVI